MTEDRDYILELCERIEKLHGFLWKGRTTYNAAELTDLLCSYMVAVLPQTLSAEDTRRVLHAKIDYWLDRITANEKALEQYMKKPMGEA